MVARIAKGLGLGAGLLSALFTLAGVFVFFSWQADRTTLRDIAVQQTQQATTDSERIVALLQWVYSNRGFDKVKSYYLVPGLGPTPIQIMGVGGDCADKSRMLSSMLAQIDIESTLLMQYPCEACESVHTVVDAQTEFGTMAVDPVYNIVFPKASGGYYSMRELKADPALLPARLDLLAQQRGPDDKINKYKRELSNYKYIRTINLRKNALTRGIRSVIGWFTDDPELAARPRMLEDPKYLVTVACTLAALFFGLFGFMALRWARAKQMPRLEGRSA